MASTRTSGTAPTTGALGLPGAGVAWMEQTPRATLGACTAWMQAGQECLRLALDGQQRMIALCSVNSAIMRC